MKKKVDFLCWLVFFCFFVFAQTSFAKEKIGCPNRYATLVNPVRGRNLWLNQTLKPLEDQYQAIAKYQFAATWLFQYDALTDKELVSFVKENFSRNQELGIFLEISPDLALNSRVIYPPLTPWYKPQVVFLSGYSRSERKRLIDTVFKKFKEEFGRYPVSVGAWWIDSYSLQYLKSKYDIKTVLIVADQQNTDDYGVWGQWWGVPYSPSKVNVLVPAQNDNSNLKVVIIQWAQRDITKAFGSSSVFSNYSLQANDYKERGLDVNYFRQLALHYLDCDLAIGQITIGLETGIESVKVFSEYKNQLAVLAQIEDLQEVTMSEFASRYQELYPSNPEKIVLKDNTSQWILSLQGRENQYLKEKIPYQENVAFADFFVADKSDFLNRKLPIYPEHNFSFSFYPVLFAFLLGLILYFRGFTKEYLHISLFILSCFWTTIFSHVQYGRVIFFGPVWKNLSSAQFFLVAIFFVLFYFFLKYLIPKTRNSKLLIKVLPLSFGADFLISVLRYTRLEDRHYFGFAWDPLRFVGFEISPRSLYFVNQDFSSLVAGAMLKFDFDVIWKTKILYLVVYPLTHIFLGILIYLLLNKLQREFRRIIIVILIIFFIFYWRSVIFSNPRVVF